jgi:hypothetical protein
MSKQLDASGLVLAENGRTALVTAEAQLRAAGYREVAQVVQRALSEFNHPAYTGAVGTIGVNLRAAYK